MVAAAMIGGAVVGAVGSAYSGKKAGDAAESAANTSSETQRYMYDQNREDSAPYRERGVDALNQLSRLYGIGPKEPISEHSRRPSMISTPDGRVIPLLQGSEEPQAAPANEPDFSAFLNSPDYKFAYEQGMRGVEQKLAKMGHSPNSGAALKAMSRFNQGLASQQLNSYKNSLAQLAGIGQTSTNQTAMMGANAAANIGNAQMAAGDARASSYLNTGSAVQNLGNTIGQYGMLQAGGFFDDN